MIYKQLRTSVENFLCSGVRRKEGRPQGRGHSQSQVILWKLLPFFSHVSCSSSKPNETHVFLQTFPVSGVSPKGRIWKKGKNVERWKGLNCSIVTQETFVPATAGGVCSLFGLSVCCRYSWWRSVGDWGEMTLFIPNPRPTWACGNGDATRPKTLGGRFNLQCPVRDSGGVWQEESMGDIMLESIFSFSTWQAIVFIVKCPRLRPFPFHEEATSRTRIYSRRTSTNEGHVKEQSSNKANHFAVLSSPWDPKNAPKQDAGVKMIFVLQKPETAKPAVMRWHCGGLAPGWRAIVVISLS